MPSMIGVFQSAWDERDISGLEQLLAEDVVFHTSAAGRPVVGKAQARFVLEMLGALFDELSYVGEYTGADGVVLLSAGVVAGKRADGIQVITVDEAGLITQMRDFVRPLSALSALSEAAAEYMARVNPAG
jgi:ketosteroid isomerase-like protein